MRDYRSLAHTKWGSICHVARRILLRGTVLLLPILGFVVGCASLGGIHDSGKSASLDPSGAPPRIPKPAQADPILAFVGSAPVSGRTGRVKMSEETEPVYVRVERVYESASGHACRRYHLSSSEGASTLSSHLACRGADGHWFQSRFFLNPDSINGQGKKALRRGAHDAYTPVS